MHEVSATLTNLDLGHASTEPVPPRAPTAAWTLSRDFRTVCRRRPDSPALWSPWGQLRYGDLAALVDTLARPDQLLARLRPGSVVVGAFANPAHLLALLYACAERSFIFCPVDPRLKAAERRQLLDLARPALVMDDATFSALAASALGVRGSGTADVEHAVPALAGPGAAAYRVDNRCAAESGAVAEPGLAAESRRSASFTAAPAASVPVGESAFVPPERAAERAPAGDTLFYLGFTSGSTGTPKGILRTQASWALSFRAMTAEFGLSPDDRVLVAGSLHHSFFLTAALHALSLGATALGVRKFVPSVVATTARRERASALYLVPTMARQLAEYLATRPPLTAVRTVIVAGARWSAEEKERLQDCLPHARLIEYYGSSEMGFVSIATPDDVTRRPASVGRLFQGVEISVRDDHGRPVASGQVGTIYARSRLTFARLLSEPAEIAARSETLDWVSAGDRGYLDEAGYLHLVGRADEQINVGGQKVFAAEVERTLLACPGVAEAVVLALDDPQLGQVVGALVQPRPDAALTATALRAWLRPRLATHKLPRRLVLVTDLPRTPNGKAARAAARALLLHPELDT